MREEGDIEERKHTLWRREGRGRRGEGRGVGEGGEGEQGRRRGGRRGREREECNEADRVNLSIDRSPHLHSLSNAYLSEVQSS